MEKSQREEILKSGHPDVPFPGEPPLGGWYTEEEMEAAIKTIRRSMDWRVGFGFITEEIRKFEEEFAHYCGSEYAVSINGAGPGLDMAMMCLDIEPGDEVISPAINFRGAHLAVIGQGAKLVLCEVDPKTLNVDSADVERRITKKTRAIFPVHMNGLSSPMDDLLEIAERYPHDKHGPLKVIGDAARACGGAYRGTKIGKKGWMNVFSFHTQKLMTTLGEGGIIITDDGEVACRIRNYRQFGVETGGWGSNYKMTKVQAAVGRVQLRRLDEMISLRRKRAQQRTELLKDIPELTLPYEPDGYMHTYYLYTILVPPEWAGEKRDRLVKMLDEDYKVGCSIANEPTYKINKLIREHTAGQKVPLSDKIGARLFCPSLHPLMTEGENTYIAAAIAEVVERIKRE